MDKITLKIGDPVIFVDPHGVEHDALITNLFHQYAKSDPDRPGTALEVEFEPVMGRYPCLNLVWVSSDKNRRDDCGRQVERMTSIVHASHTAAHGNLYKLRLEK